MEIQQTGDLPTMSQDARTVRRTRYLVAKTRSEQVPGVEVTVAVVGLKVVGVIGNGSTVLADLVQGMRPGVARLRSQAMPTANSKRRLESVVVGGTNAVELNDGSKVWKRVVLVDVRHDIQLASLAADVSNLCHDCRTEALLDLQVVVGKVRHPEVLTHRKQILPSGGRA